MILIFRWMYTNENIVMHIILHQFLSLKRLRAKRTDWFKFSQITKTLLKVMFNNVDFLTRCLIWVKNSDYRYNTFDTTEWYYHIILNKRYGKSINRFDTLDASLLWSVKSVKIMRGDFACKPCGDIFLQLEKSQRVLKLNWEDWSCA